METIAITGGTGLIGSALSKMLIAKNYRVIVFSRARKADSGDISYALWDPSRGEIDPVAFAQCDHIIHLAGAGVAEKRWTKKRKKEIVDSRVDGGRTIVKALADLPNKIQTVVSSSAIGWYGPDRVKHAPFRESDPAFGDFLGKTCSLWEESIMPVEAAGKRLVIIRTGIVLSNEGGAFAEFKKPLKAGVASILGSGKQVISWIHIDDICRVYIAAIESPHMRGIYNGVAPEPVNNRDLILSIARTRKRSFLPVHVPEFSLKLMLGEMSIEVLKSTTVDGSKLRAAGFRFIYPTIDSAVNALIKSG